MSHRCWECDNGQWVCGSSTGCDEGGEVRWQSCGTAFLPTPIGLRFAVRVLARVVKDKDGPRAVVKLIPVDTCVPITEKCIETPPCKDLVPGSGHTSHE